MNIVFNAFFLPYFYLYPPHLSVPPSPVLLYFVHSLESPIALRCMAGPIWHRTFHLLGGIPGWLMFPAFSSLGRPLEPIIGIGALLLSDLIGYHLEQKSRRAFLQRVRAARSV